jgi:hypothetical protein
MATLQQIYDIRYGPTGLLPRVAAACMVVARDVVNEDPGTANHDLRLNWAQHAIDDPQRAGGQMMTAVALSDAAQTRYDPGKPDLGLDDDSILAIVATTIERSAGKLS